MSDQKDTELPPQAIALQLAMTFELSQAVSVATRLGIADLLGKHAMKSDAIAQAIGAQPTMIQRLLRALAAFDVVKDLGAGEFQLTPVGDCLRADVPNSVRSLVLINCSDSFWQTCGSLIECVRTGRNAFDLVHGAAGIFPYLEKHPDLARTFDDAMSGRSAITGRAVAQGYDFSTIERIVDIGGGHGGMLASILKVHSHLRGTLFDLPRVVQGASRTLTNEGVADRCATAGGDMLASVPDGGDLYLLSHVIHDWDDVHAIKILQVCRRAMRAGAKLLILDRVMRERIEPTARARSDVLLDLAMMMWTSGGRERTAQEFEALLRAADLRLEQIIPLQIPDSLVEAMPV